MAQRTKLLYPVFGLVGIAILGIVLFYASSSSSFFATKEFTEGNSIVPISSDNITLSTSNATDSQILARQRAENELQHNIPAKSLVLRGLSSLDTKSMVKLFTYFIIACMGVPVAYFMHQNSPQLLATITGDKSYLPPSKPPMIRQAKTLFLDWQFTKNMWSTLLIFLKLGLIPPYYLLKFLFSIELSLIFNSDTSATGKPDELCPIPLNRLDPGRHWFILLVYTGLLLFAFYYCIFKLYGLWHKYVVNYVGGWVGFAVVITVFCHYIYYQLSKERK